MWLLSIKRHQMMYVLSFLFSLSFSSFSIFFFVMFVIPTFFNILAFFIFHAFFVTLFYSVITISSSFLALHHSRFPSYFRFTRYSAFPVIPAKAGIQFFLIPSYYFSMKKYVEFKILSFLLSY